MHTAGTTLVVPGNFVMKAVTDRTDKMRVEGVLQARDENGTSTNFTINKGGVEVAAGGSFVVDAGRSLYVQSSSGVTGGTLSIGGNMTIGTTNKPTVFTQSGGGVNTTYTYDGYYGNVTIQNASRYEQSGGSLQVGGSGGSADLTLTGGSRYVLSGGTATITDELIVSGAGDVYQQSGGVMSVSDIRGRTAGRLEVTGGNLNIGHRFDLAASATLDFGSGTATMTVASNAVADLALGTVSNAGNTTYTAGVQSESYFPVGFNPYTAFNNFSSQGLVHSTNTRIVVPTSYAGQAQRLVAQSVEIRGTLSVQAGGAITSAADVTIAGGTLLGGGTITAASVVNSGVIAPGFSPGKLAINSSLSQTSAGTLSLEVEGTGRGTTYDWLAVTGSATLAGSLHVTSATHPRLPIGTMFDVLAASSVSGTFTNFLDETYLGLRWSIFEGNTLRLTTTADGSGDFILDVISGGQSQADAGRPRIAAANSVVKTGSGTLVFVAANTYQGPTAVNGGELQIGDGGTAGSLSNASPVSVASGAKLAFNRSDAHTYGGTISGSGSLTHRGVGRLTLSATNNYTGDTVISKGTLALASGGSFAQSSRVIVGDASSSGAVLDLTEQGAFQIGASQMLTGKGTVVLDASTNLTIRGLFSPGNSPGLFTYDANNAGGTVTLSGTTLMELWGTTRGLDSGYDAVNVTNGVVLTLGGLLRLDFDQSFTVGTSFSLFETFSGASLVGGFSSISITGTNSDYTGLAFTHDGSVWTTGYTVNNQGLRLTQTPSSVFLEVITIAVPEPSTLVLAGIGLAAVGIALRKRRRA